MARHKGLSGADVRKEVKGTAAGLPPGRDPNDGSVRSKLCAVSATLTRRRRIG
jgi:hypothetical protein